MIAGTVTAIKRFTSSMGDIDLDIPRDRRGEFEPQIVKTSNRYF